MKGRFFTFIVFEIIYIRGLFVKFVDKSYNFIKSTTILIKCISFEINTPIQSKQQTRYQNLNVSDRNLCLKIPSIVSM